MENNEKLYDFEPGDSVLHQAPFTEDEARYDLVHGIASDLSSLRLKAGDHRLLFVRTPGWNGWLWMDASLGQEERERRMMALIEETDRRAIRLGGVHGTREDIDFFTECYAQLHGLDHRPNMELEAYVCHEVQAPSGVAGNARVVMPDDVGIVAEYLSGFIQDAFGTESGSESLADAAAGLASSGNLYFWEVDGEPVAMANMAAASPRYRRINEVYTPRPFRKKGYASALVSEICLRLKADGITPVLYADCANPDSNAVYRKIGFKENGRLLDARFTERTTE